MSIPFPSPRPRACLLPAVILTSDLAVCATGHAAGVTSSPGEPVSATSATISSHGVDDMAATAAR